MNPQTPTGAGPADPAYDQRLKREPESGRFAEPRGWWDRTADEVSSWFGNVDALRRRQRDVAVGDHVGQGPTSSLDADARIIDAISRQLTEDALLDASRVRVACREGIVTLSGEVTTTADKGRAEHLAAAAPGATRVENELLVA